MRYNECKQSIWIHTGAKEGFILETDKVYNSQTIYSTLRDEILSLGFKPGEQISENEICERFHVSRTPVRNAFQRLKDAGLLNSEPYKSTCVTLLDFDQIRQLIYMRVSLESSILRELVISPDPLTMQKIHHNLTRQKEMIESGHFSPHDFFEIDSNLHRIWFISTRKELLWKLVQKAQVNYTRFRMLDIVAVQNFQEIYNEHLELVELIQSQKVDAIEPLIRRHMNGGVARLGERIYTELSDYFVSNE